MEEPKPPSEAATENPPAQVTTPPPDTPQTVPPQAPSPPPPPPPPPPTISKKRPLDNRGQLQHSNYYKMRLVLKDLRPHIIELLRTTDFRNCKVTHEVREKIKILVELCKAETVIAAEVRDVAERQPPQDVKVAEQPQQDKLSAKPSEIESKKLQGEDGETQGSCIVGGSAFGWNFITFAGTQPVYYGVTKELFRKLNSEGQ